MPILLEEKSSWNNRHITQKIGELGITRDRLLKKG
jgi:hypothetical protein